MNLRGVYDGRCDQQPSHLACYFSNAEWPSFGCRCPPPQAPAPAGVCASVAPARAMRMPSFPNAESHMPIPKYITIRKFEELTGYTEEAVRAKIKRGDWLEGAI